MDIHIQPELQQNPMLTQLVERANAVIQDEIGVHTGPVHVDWSVDTTDYRPVLRVTIANDTKCDTPFFVPDFQGDMESLRDKLRQWCGQTIAEIRKP